MDNKEKILDLAKKKNTIRSSDVVALLKVSRQYAGRLLLLMVNAGELAKVGSTRSAFYMLPEKRNQLVVIGRIRIKNENVQEHLVFERLFQDFPQLYQLPENVKSIFQYAFLEMLNNAIEHSETKYIEIEINEDKDNIFFVVRDFGIGVFKSIQEKLHLNSDFEAINDLLKGKTTTAPKLHSGEGIFFTSKIADDFMLSSFDKRLTVNNEIRDVFVSQIESLRGTEVRFFIKKNSEKHLGDVFKRFESKPGAQDFGKTEILVRLFTQGTVHVSRSQARRILEGLDKFKKIIFDFDKVPNIGQAFADEVFRVFTSKHPKIEIEYKNANEAVEFMIKRVDR